MLGQMLKKHIKRNRNWIMALSILAVLYAISLFIAYVGTYHLAKSNKTLLAFFAESYTYSMFIYAISILLAIVLMSLVRIAALYRKQDIEFLLAERTYELNMSKQILSEKIKKTRSLLDLAPMGIFITEKSKILDCNEWVQRFLKKLNRQDFPSRFEEAFISGAEMLKYEKKAWRDLKKFGFYKTETFFETRKGEKIYVQLSAYCLTPKMPDKGVIWFVLDSAATIKNIELETYYQTVFRAMSILHTAEENNSSDENILSQLLDEIIGIYGIKTAFYLRVEDNHIEFVFTAGEDADFPNRWLRTDVDNPDIQNSAIIKALKTRKACIYNDIESKPYYQKYFKRNGKLPVKATFAFPIIIDNKIEGVVSLYGYEVGAFSDSLIFRILQLNTEICKNLANIRMRRRAREAIRQYEDRLRNKIHELQSNKKALQKQADDVNAMVSDLVMARDAAEKANKSKTEFLANISHELRTPLNAILGFSEAMESETFGPIENKQYKQYIGYISSSGKHLLSLINDVLDISKAEAGKYNLSEEVAPVLPIIDDIVSIISKYPGGDKRFIRVKPQEVTWKLNVDTRALKQALLNVLSNAIKFTHENGHIDIEVSLTPAHEMIILVKDDGIGIPTDKIDNLFQPFTQVENVMTREHTGSGLGLVLIKKLVEMHQGRVWLESVEGSGTSFYMLFPAERVREK